MGFGASLAFFAIGAILAFAVKWDVPGIDLQLIGWIFMGVGLIGGLLTLMYTRRPREDLVEVVEPDTVFIADPDPAVEPRTQVIHHVAEPTAESRTEVIHRTPEPSPEAVRPDPLANPPHSRRDTRL